jgi:hypothetical protein
MHIPTSRFREGKNINRPPGGSGSGQRGAAFLKVRDDDRASQRPRSEGKAVGEEEQDNADLFLEIIERYDDALAEGEGRGGWV